METDPPSPENPGKEEQGSSQAKTYECTFCKRGFSNAQALGGHMNIHRKDKAKLKQASTTTHEAQQFLEIPIRTPHTLYSSPMNLSPNTIQQLEFMSSGASDHLEKQTTNKWPWMFSPSEDEATSRDETHVGEKTSNIENQNTSAAVIHPSDFGSSEPELDLELRLGHEPRDSSSSKPGIKKFL